MLLNSGNAYINTVVPASFAVSLSLVSVAAVNPGPGAGDPPPEESLGQS